MKPFAFFTLALLALGLVGGTAGCSTASMGANAQATKGPPTYALAVNVVGDQPPTAAQWTALNALFAQKIAEHGGVLISDVGQARYIIRVEYLPGIGDSASGSAVVLDVGPNPLIQTAGRAGGRPASSAIYSYANAAYDPMFNSNSAYYRSIYGYDYQNWGNDYYYSNPAPVNTGGSGTPTTPPGHPLHHPPTNPVDCPPGSVGQPPPSYVVNHPHHPNPPDNSSPPPHFVGDPHHSVPRDSAPSPSFAASRSESTYSPSNSSGSSSYSSSPSSSSSYSSSSSSSSSYSAPSYTPSESSSSSSSSNSGGSERAPSTQQQN